MIYWLTKDNRKVFRLEIQDRDTSFFEFAISEVTLQYEDNKIETKFFADVYFKFDFCTHWNFNGEDYPKENDAYYHLCGSTEITKAMCAFAFARKVALEVLGDSCNEYTKHDKEVDDKLLEGYEIIKYES